MTDCWFDVEDLNKLGYAIDLTPTKPTLSHIRNSQIQSDDFVFLDFAGYFVYLYAPNVQCSNLYSTKINRFRKCLASFYHYVPKNDNTRIFSGAHKQKLPTDVIFRCLRMAGFDYFHGVLYGQKFPVDSIDLFEKMRIPPTFSNANPPFNIIDIGCEFDLDNGKITFFLNVDS